ncbi:sigma factor-like helix-turn-helix DNA-binding protein [Paenibacillus pabuli]|uniref:sigma factor-like helix-turn-helix DNA-binding protein n=1 Tax=Paenibacillus pabuli TaxID=1472 RepID=UPI003242C899
MDVTKEVRRAQRGNVQAFENLIQAHKVVMYLLKAFEKIKTLREPVFFKTWLLRIVINECNLIHRQNKKVTDLSDFAVPFTFENGYGQIELEQLLEALPGEDRRLLEQYHINDISIKDLAEIYQKSENTIKTRLRRARENARHILEKQEGYAWKNGSSN